MCVCVCCFLFFCSFNSCFLFFLFLFFFSSASFSSGDGDSVSSLCHHHHHHCLQSCVVLCGACLSHHIKALCFCWCMMSSSCVSSCLSFMSLVFEVVLFSPLCCYLFCWVLFMTFYPSCSVVFLFLLL